jgi:hypothetical protein
MMSINRLPNGFFEVRVHFDSNEPRFFKYATRFEAQELIESEKVFLLLRQSGATALCTNGEIHAAADALLRAPCEQDVVQLRWTRSKSRWIRSWSFDGFTYSLYAKRREERVGKRQLLATTE